MDAQQVIQWLCDERARIVGGNGDTLSKAMLLNEVVHDTIDSIGEQPPDAQAPTLAVIGRLLQGEEVPGISLVTSKKDLSMQLLKDVFDTAPRELGGL